jgi:mannosyl-3-phosphoglycerate phosphatase
MAAALPLLVFSDLDGTLLDHANYEWAAARPALKALAAIGAGVVLATSKTAAEVDGLRDRMALGNWPAVVENGAGVLAPGAQTDADDADFRLIRDRLRDLPEGFRGFADMSDEEVARATGLSPQDAAKSRRRQHSEPGVWTGKPEDLERFLAAAARAGLSARRGGRFLTLSLGHTKADRMREITSELSLRMTVALGDAPNDLEMLVAADRGFLVSNPHAPPMPDLPNRIRRTAAQGPAGWSEAIFGLLKELEPNGDLIPNG